MFFGAQYYRPPFPYPCDWERDIRHMKELKFNVVKLWAVWNAIEKEPNRFDFGDLDALVDICKKNGLNVIINTIPEGAPYWTESDLRDHFYKTAEGHALDYSGPANIPTAGWPGLCPDSAKARALIENFIYSTASHFADNDTVIAIDVWNEPHLEPMFDYSGQLLCYCEHSVRRFQDWLKERYGTLANLNKYWFRYYTDWEQVTPPVRFGTYADMIDWRRFWLYNLADWMKMRTEAARRGAPEKLIQSHSAFSGYMGALNQGGLGNELGDEFLLARHVDMYGLSSFPRWLMGEEHVMGHLINAEIIAEAAGDKPFYQVELQGGAGKSGLLGGLVPTAEDVRQWNWSVIAAGGKGVVYWQYSPEPAGMESPGFGLVDFMGGDTPRSLSASKCAELFNQDYLTYAKRVPPVNGIYLSRDSDLITYAAKEEDKYTSSFVGIYKALMDRGIPVRFVHQDTLKKALKENLEILYMPMALALSHDEKDVLLQFVENGGTLIIEGCTGIYGVNGEIDMSSSFLKSMLGMEHVTLEAIPGNKITAKTINSGVGFGCAYYRQFFQTCAEDASVTARFMDGIPAVLKRTIKSGEVIWLGGFAGAYYNMMRDKDTGSYIASLFDPRGYDAFNELKSNGLLVRLLESKALRYIVAVNHSEKEKSFYVRLLSGKEIKMVIAPRDGCIIQAG